ncbi:Hect ubiquitin ligase [Globisporangium polare]
MLEYVSFFVFLGGVFILAIYLGSRPSSHNHGGLAAPLLQDLAVAGDHRVEVAVRDAAEGYTLCTFCAFENFKRFPFCSLCDQELQDTQKLQASAATEEEQGASKPAALTQRQKRARKRREWTRKLDVEGKLYWFREASDPEFGGPIPPGYCLRFQTREVPTDRIVNVRVDGETSRSSPERASFVLTRGGSVEIEYPVNLRCSTLLVTSTECVEMMEESEPGFEIKQQPRAPLAVESVRQELSTCVANSRFQLIESSVSNPAESPLESLQPGATTTGSPTVDTSTQNFPVKYADFVKDTVTLMAPAENEILKFNMSRELLLEDSMESLSIIPEIYIRASMRVNFVNEPGLDAGGLQREWFVLLDERLVDNEAGVLRCVNQTDRTFYLNPSSAYDIGEDHLMYYFATGRLIGRALLEGQVLGFHLALPLLKIILGQPLTFQDLAYFDPEMYKSMLWIKENAGVEHLGLDFSVTEKRGEEIAVVDLIPNGRNIDVTDESKHLYLESKFQYLLFESVSSQLHVFLKGLYEVIPQATLLRFDPEELDYVLCGSDTIDVDDWERSTQVTSSLKGMYLVKWFWEIVREMPNEYRQRLLHFSTGSSRVPIAGFSALTSNDGRLCPFTLKLNESATSRGYIWSHACFNRLDLPVLRSKEQLETSLYATLRTELNGFTTD